MELSLCTLIPLSFRPGVRQKCLNELRHTYDWMRVPWWVVCELISVMGFHTMPGQHSHATLTASHWLLIINTYTKSMVLRTLFVSFQGWLITVIPRKQTNTARLSDPLRTGRKKRARLRDFWKTSRKSKTVIPGEQAEKQDYGIPKEPAKKARLCDFWKTSRKSKTVIPGEQAEKQDYGIPKEPAEKARLRNIWKNKQEEQDCGP